MKLHNILEDIKENPERLIKDVSVREFESRVKKILNEEYVERFVKRKGVRFKEFKEYVRNYENDRLVGFEDMLYSNQFIYQPFSTQNSPDFLIRESVEIINFEAKCQEDEQIVWNRGACMYPKAIYLIGSINSQDVTFMFQEDCCSKEDIKKQNEVLDEIDRFSQELCEKAFGNQPNGFGVKTRKRVEQSKTYNKNADTNYFKSPNREEREGRVLNYLKLITSST